VVIVESVEACKINKAIYGQIRFRNKNWITVTHVEKLMAN